MKQLAQYQTADRNSQMELSLGVDVGQEMMLKESKRWAFMHRGQVTPSSTSWSSDLRFSS